MPNSLPTVTVIMPVRNESRHITRSLGAVIEQDYPAEKLEIIVVDGMSDDETLALIEQIPTHRHLHVLTNPAIYQSAGLNQAIQVAQGEIIVRVDGHTIIARDYVRRCVATLYATKAHAVGGKLYAVGQTPMGKVIARASASRFAIPSAFRTGRTSGWVDTVYLGAWKRATLEEIGLFNEMLVANEDYELYHRLRKANKKIYLSQSICSEYYGAETFRQLARQHFRYGYWKAVMLRFHPRSIKLRHIAAPLFILYVVVASSLYLATREIWMLLGLLVYSCLLAAASIQLLVRQPTDWLRLPTIFLVIHVSWGTGFWWSLIRHRINRAA